MQIVSQQKETMTQYGKTTNCDVYTIHVKIVNVAARVSDMIKIISDKSWINKLDVLDQKSYTARAQRTIEKIVEDILKKVNNTVSSDFGEYLVSMSAGKALEDVHKHSVFPLSELWNERLSGNAGFDFHTESPSELIAFGEAKYNSNSNSHSTAINQTVGFITDEKDQMDLADLRRFASQNASNNAMTNKKAFVIAFSLHAPNYSQAFISALSSTAIDPLLSYPELYLIGIET
jgi:hypothetical protein